MLGDMSSSRRTALVTGPTAGIGRSFVAVLAARGYDLVLVARDRERLEELARSLSVEHRVEVQVLVADLADRAAIAAVESRLADRSRPVELLVNNAGHGIKGSFVDTDVEDEQALLDILVTAVLRLSHAAAAPMVERGHGAIVNVSSVAGFLPRGTYGAAKAYVTSLTTSLDLTYRGRGVRAMALCPGFVRTEFHERMGLGRGFLPGWLWLDADRVVRDGLADLDRGRTVSVPSRRYALVAGFARYAPLSLRARFTGRLSR